VIGPSLRPLPDNTKQSQQTLPCPPAGLGPSIPASERLRAYFLDRAANAIDNYTIRLNKICKTKTPEAEVQTVNVSGARSNSAKNAAIGHKTNQHLKRPWAENKS